MSIHVGAQESLVQQAIDEYTSAMEVTQRDQRLASFARAEQLFRQVIEEAQAEAIPLNADLWTNFGNAALQAEHVGVAILAYRRALWCDPGHGQARQNLAHARNTLPEWAQRSENHAWVETLFFWQRLYSARQIAIASAFFFLLTAVLLAISIAARRPWCRGLATIPCLVWLVLSLSLWLNDSEGTADAVIISQDVTLYSADSENAAPRLSSPLPDGTEVKILQTRDRWTEVQIAGRSGWVRTSVLGGQHAF